MLMSGSQMVEGYEGGYEPYDDEPEAHDPDADKDIPLKKKLEIMGAHAEMVELYGEGIDGQKVVP